MRTENAPLGSWAYSSNSGRYIPILPGLNHRRTLYGHADRLFQGMGKPWLRQQYRPKFLGSARTDRLVGLVSVRNFLSARWRHTAKN